MKSNPLVDWWNQVPYDDKENKAQELFMRTKDHEAFLRELLDILLREMPYKGLIAKEMPLNRLYWKIRNELDGCCRD